MNHTKIFPKQLILLNRFDLYNNFMIKRKLNFVTSSLLNLQYYPQVNEHNIQSLSRWKLWWIFRNEELKIKQIYLHNIIDRWANNQDQLSLKFLNHFKKLIRKTKLQLNALETQNLNLIEERIFSSIRHIKELNVNFKLYDKEIVCGKFISSELYIITNNQMNLMFEGDLLLTNRRFIIHNSVSGKHVFLFYRVWKKYQFTNYGVIISDNKNHHLVLRIHDQITLSQTFINVVQKRVKWLAKDIDFKRAIAINKHNY